MVIINSSGSFGRETAVAADFSDDSSGSEQSAVIPSFIHSFRSVSSSLRCSASKMDFPIEGIEQYGDDRDALNDFAKYYNNVHLSDISLVVGDEMCVVFACQ
jgi:hypothetical protein